MHGHSFYLVRRQEQWPSFSALAISVHQALNYEARCNNIRGQKVSDHVSEMSVLFEINRTKCPCILQILMSTADVLILATCSSVP